MGVSGAGKSTLGRGLATSLNWPFVEGDTLHPAANIAKMSAGMTLDDADRQPFLQRVAEVCRDGRAAGIVVSCSALKRRYRDLIRSIAGGITFVLPVVNRDVLLERLAHRQNHFMPASLLDSQLDSLELPGPEEAVIIVDGSASTEAQVQRVIARLCSPRSSQNAGVSNAGPP
jgi:gluconokinase